VSDTFRAADLTREHVGRRLRVGGHEGILHDLTPIDDSHVQLLLAEPGMPPLVPVVGQGAVVELLD
jgi:hypothetical protein